MAFEVPPLPYDYNALEPHIDEQTMRLHHDKHHQAYVDNANKALDGTELADKPVEHVLTNLDILPEDKRAAVRNNAGGHVNHSLFWEIMGPDGGGEPSGALAQAIEETFDGLDELKQLVNDTGEKRLRAEGHRGDDGRLDGGRRGGREHDPLDLHPPLAQPRVPLEEDGLAGE